MRTRIAAAVRIALLLLIALPFAAAAQETQDTASLPESLRPIRTALGAAYARLDGATAATFFADDAAIEFDGQVLSGKQAVTGWFMQMFSQLEGLRPGTTTFRIAEDQVTERGSHVVIVQGQEQAGSSETVWKRQADGSWKVARLIVL
jgi:ketosteroid isomerase-like protein